MAPRKRKSGSDDLPDNLYSNGEYFRYKNPVTGEWRGMKRDKAKAVAAAKKLNAILEGKSDLVRMVLGDNSNNWAKLVSRFIVERQGDEGKKESTVREENWRLKHIVKGLGRIDLEDTTQKLISGWLTNTFTGNSYTKHRGTLIKLFAFGIASGMFADGFQNLAESTLPAREMPKVRKALTLEQFNAVHACAEPWLQVAMDIALITLQRRSDIIKMKYTDIEDGYLKVIQNKTEKHGERAFLRIKIGHGLADAISRSRLVAPVCPFIVHRQPERKVDFAGQEHWAQVRDQYLTKAFNAAYKKAEKAGKVPKFAAGEQPTFHEIRGLGGATYKRNDYSDSYVNLLMGHTTQRMTDDYTKQHINWTECAADMELAL